MRAIELHGGELALVDAPEPQPAIGQLLVEVRRCGICGSDLHARRHGDELADVLELCGYDHYMRSGDRVVMGHEVFGVVTDYGAWSGKKLALGTPVVTIPLVRRDGVVDGLGLSANAPGGYAERVVVQEAMTIPVPNGLAPDIAAMTEPMAVAWHAVARGEIMKKDVAVVVGCGPVGLAVIAVLKARGVEHIVASDPSPSRRALAAACGAHVVVDPAVEGPLEVVARGHHGHMPGMPQEYAAGIDVMEGLAKLPVPWWTAWRALDKLGKTTTPRPIVFECVGIPGMIDGILAGAPLHTRVVVVGVCMGVDAVRPSLAINKEVDLRFVVGYSPLEFRDTLHALAEGKLDAGPIVTGRVGLEGVKGAFATLADSGGTHAKMLIDPSLRDLPG